MTADKSLRDGEWEEEGGQLLEAIQGHPHQKLPEEEAGVSAHFEGETSRLFAFNIIVWIHLFLLDMQEFLAPIYFLLIIVILELSIPTPFYPEVIEPEVNATKKGYASYILGISIFYFLPFPRASLRSTVLCRSSCTHKRVKYI